MYTLFLILILIQNICIIKITIQKKIKIVYRDFDTYQDLINEINSYGVLECSTLHNVDV